MNTWTFRPPTLDDAERVLDLQIRSDIAEYGEGDSELTDLLHEWESIDLSQDAWLALDAAGNLAGYAVVLPYGARLRYMFYADPALGGAALGSVLLARCMARGRALAPGKIAVVDCAHVNERNRQILLQAGFRTTRYTFQMRTRLDAPLHEPRWPEGIAVRTAVAGQDEAAVYALIEAAFSRPGRTPRSYEDWRAAMLRADIFDPTLWFLAFAGDELAGACLCYHYPDGGWIRQLGVVEGWRRRGLGGALLRHAFHEFKRRGAADVGLGVAGDNPNACALYENAGMRRARQYDEYTQPIE